MRIQKTSNYIMMIELILGIVLYFLAGEVLVLLFAQRKLYETIGFVAGVLASLAMIVHMAYSIETSVSMGEEEALKHIRIAYIIRIIIALAVFGILFFFKLGDVVATLFGMLSMKVAAYIQPITHKVTQKYTDKGR